MTLPRYIGALFFTIMICSNADGQNKEIDSLFNLIKKDKEACPRPCLRDTSKVKHLNDLAWQLKYRNVDTSIILSSQALQAAEKLVASPDEAIAKAGKKGMAISFANLGSYNILKANYPKALHYYFKALKKNEELRNKNGIAANLGNIGIVYKQQADYAKALDYYFKALKIKEELGNKNGIANTLGNIGVVYSSQNDYSQALNYYFKALKIQEELGNKQSIAANLANIGSVYNVQADLSSRQTGPHAANPTELSLSFGLALNYYLKALKMAEEVGNKNFIAASLGNIGGLYTKTRKFAEAEKYLKQSLALCDSIKALNYTRDFEKSLSQLYETTGRTKLAFEHYKKYLAARDSINSEENQKKQARTEINHEFEKKEALAKAEQDKKDLLAEEEKQKQKLFLWFTIGGLAVVVIVSIFIFRSLQINKKKNMTISEQKTLVEHQKKIVEEKQKEILDSIHYAKRIQTALLTSEKYINRNLNTLKK